MGTGLCFGGNKNILELDNGDGCITLQIYQQPLSCPTLEG